MTGNDRMERARRIRRMREGKRIDEDSEESSDEDPDATAEVEPDATAEAEPDATAEAEPDATAEAEPDATAEAEPDATADVGAGTEAGAETTEAETASETAAKTAEDEAELESDEEIEEATDRDGSGAHEAADDASESVPSAEEMAASVEGDPVSAGEPAESEAAKDVAEATAARAAEASEALTAESSGDGTEAVSDDEAGTGADDEGAVADADDAEAETETTADTGAARSSGKDGSAGGSEERTRVLEFTLDDEQYCLDIRYIEEIVKGEYITRVPNTPEFVEGVVDLRGQITTILNPKVTIGKDDTDPGDLIVVFDGEAFEEQGYVGWIVDDVRQVTPVTDEEINDPPMAEDYINGVIDREEDDEFVVWTSPDLAFEGA